MSTIKAGRRSNKIVLVFKFLDKPFWLGEAEKIKIHNLFYALGADGEFGDFYRFCRRFGYKRDHNCFFIEAVENAIDRLITEKLIVPAEKNGFFKIGLEIANCDLSGLYSPEEAGLLKKAGRMLKLALTER